MYTDHAFVNDRHILEILHDLGILADQLAARQQINAEKLYDLVLALRTAVATPDFSAGPCGSKPTTRDVQRLRDHVSVLSDATYLYGAGHTDVTSIIARAIRAIRSTIAERNAALAYATGRAMIASIPVASLPV